MHVLRGLGVGVLVAGLAFVGCGGGRDEGDDEMAPDTVTMEGALEETVEDAGGIVEEAGDAMGEGIEATGEAIGEGVEETGEAIGEGAEAFLQGVRALGKRMVLLTNSDPFALRLKHERTGVLDYFHAAASSRELSEASAGVSPCFKSNCARSGSELK